MYRAPIYVAVLCLSLVAGVVEAQSPLAGEWAGGYEIGGSYTPIRTQFRLEGDKLAGTVNLPVREVTSGPLSQITFLPPHVHFEWADAAARFDGQLNGDVITGDVQAGDSRGTFHLLRSIALDPKLFDQYTGDYEIGRGRYVSIEKTSPDLPTPGINYVEHDRLSPAHRHGRLFPMSETTFVAGPARWVPYPIERTVTFIRNDQGRVTALRWKPAGAREVVAKKVVLHVYDEEQVKFSNGGITIAGTLTLPLMKGPHPAIVLIAGSDGGTRLKGGLPGFFAQHGIAALSCDKRGYGESTGTITGVTIDEMASDISAAVRFLQNRKDIDARQVGLWAISQGGWIAPVVATRIPNLAFMILHAGPAVSPRVQGRQELVDTVPLYGYSPGETREAVEYQNLYLDAMNSDEAYDKLQAAYSQATARGARWAWKPPEKDAMRKQWIRPNVDFDPAPVLEKVKCPVLAFFGEKDVLVPPSGNAAIMKAALEKAGNDDITIRILPGVNHNFELPGKGTYGFQSSGKVPPGYYDVMLKWLEKHISR